MMQASVPPRAFSTQLTGGIKDARTEATRKGALKHIGPPAAECLAKSRQQELQGA